MDGIGKRIQMLVATALLLSFGPVTVSANQKLLSANTLAKYYTDARDVLENLNDYQALWIKVHGCV